jgi:hypothetical protein
LEALPKRPGNAYAIFLKATHGRQDIADKIETIAKKEAGGDPEKMKRMRIGLIGKMSGELWRGMSDKEKLVSLVRCFGVHDTDTCVYSRTKTKRIMQRSFGMRTMVPPSPSRKKPTRLRPLDQTYLKKCVSCFVVKRIN